MAAIFKTVRGFLSDGKEEPSELIFKYSAALRIGGLHLNFDKLNYEFGIQASRYHKKGDMKGEVEFDDDMWLYETTPVISELDELDLHLEHLHKVFLPHLDLLLDLQRNNNNISIYPFYLTNCDSAGIEISPKNLHLFQALQIPFGISISFL